MVGQSRGASSRSSGSRRALGSSGRKRVGGRHGVVAGTDPAHGGTPLEGAAGHVAAGGHADGADQGHDAGLPVHRDVARAPQIAPDPVWP
jgi:hypothetical protein